MLKQRHQLFVTMFAGIDALVVTLACVLAWSVRHWVLGEAWPETWSSRVREPLVLSAVPVCLGVMWASGLYRARRDRSLASEIAQVIKASLISVCALVVLAWGMGEPSFLGPAHLTVDGPFGAIDAPRVQFAALAVALPALLVSFRISLRLVLRRLRRSGWNQRHVAIVGDGRLGQIAARTLSRNGWTGINVAYFVSHKPVADREQCLGRPVRAGLDGLERTLEEYKVDGVYLALPHGEWPLLPALLKRLEAFALDVRIIPDVPLRYMPQRMAVNELEGMPVLSYRESPLHGVGGVSKRGLDMAGSLAALLIFAPVMLISALAVRLSGPGPVIFRQRRVGWGGEEFWIYKFRTMRHGEEEQAPCIDDLDDATKAWTQRDDPRITRVGRWLRRTSLDELPQLFNVLKGEMSLVGPRPERPELISRFKDDWRGYMLRQHVKAGMTGWAQVNGHRGNSNLRKRLQHDLFYIRHWSLRFDLWILWLTVFRGFFHRNAI
ncbi:MAG: undecaprenyl-phosphate glucose phosphotransferase [Phycisphaerales bacterium]|nr:undecaprenyl-phosphate glucose phosphotransferase [Phycisphaerales bacterium]